jgi:hypothetical protein
VRENMLQKARTTLRITKTQRRERSLAIPTLLAPVAPKVPFPSTQPIEPMIRTNKSFERDQRKSVERHSDGDVLQSVLLAVGLADLSLRTLLLLQLGLPVGSNVNVARSQVEDVLAES